MRSQVLAHNPATTSANKIHDDTVARRYGFAGGLVPGVTLFGYLSRPVLERWGTAWQERGTMAARFRRPVYEGDLLTITASDTGEGLDLEATNEESVACAVGTASLPPAPATAPALDEFPLTPSPDPPLAATPEALAAVGLLGCLEATARGEEPGALVHPVWLLLQANALLATAVALGPWIHTASVLTNLAPLHHGEPVSVRARVAALSARRGHELVDLDILVVAEGGRPTTHIRHSAIYRLSPSEHEG